MVIGASAHDGTTSGRIGRGSNHIAVQAEVRHQGSGSSHFERIARVGGNHGASLGPVDEGIARSGGGRQRGGLAMVIGPGARDGTTSGRIGRSGNRIAVQAEVRHQSHSLSHFERIARVGGYHYSSLGPVDEGIARSGGGGQRGGLAMVISASASDGTTNGRVCRSGDLKGILDEVCHV